MRLSFRDWITYMMKQMLWFMETPRTERKAQRLERKEPWLEKWFGIVPIGTKLFVEKQLERRHRSQKPTEGSKPS